MRDRYVTFGTAACAIVLASAPARAAPRTVVALDYGVSADAGCPDASGFRESVARQLHYDPFRAGASQRVAVHIARREQGFDGHIEWSDETGRRVGERRLSSRSPECKEIASNVAFAVAVQIQLMATLTPDDANAETTTKETGSSTSTAPQQNENVPAPAKSPEPPSRPAETPHSAEGRAVRLGFSAGIGASLGLGLAPNALAIGRAFAAARLSAFSLELAFDGALPTTFRRPDGAGFSLTRFATSAAACGHVDRFAACLTGGVGRLEARGIGVDRPSSSAGFFSQLGGRVGATFRFGERFFVVARADGAVTLSNVSVKLDDTVVWTTPRVGGIVGSDVGFFF